MTELDTMKRAKGYIDALANGIDPISEQRFDDDSFMNNARISRCLNFVSGVLEKVINNGGEVVKRSTSGVAVFTISEEQLNKIEITEEAVGISDFTKRINALLESKVKPIAAQHITRWLLSEGYLTENIYNGQKKKLVTPKGQSIGMIMLDGVSKTGVAYKKILYTAAAQRFVVKNLTIIAEALQEQKRTAAE